MEDMRKQVLIGTDSFEKIREGNFFYVDKSLFIKELLDNRGDATLITRPRRFGKTLNMNMLKCFFDVRSSGTHLFNDLLIMEYKETTKEHMSKYPVIFITLKDIEQTTFDKSMVKLNSLVSSLYKQYRYIHEHDEFDDVDKERFMQYRNGKVVDEVLQFALSFLMECLYIYYGKRVIVLIDEYDTPIDSAERNGYYSEMIGFMRGFLRSVFKTNDNLEFGVLTGVQRISKEGLFSSFNNPKVCGVLDRAFATSFGFTEEEVRAACDMFGEGKNYNRIKHWYDGYRMGGYDIFNPWSITMYLDTLELGNYWVNTGSVQMLRDMFKQGDDRLKNDIAGLLTGTPVNMSLTDQITYPIDYSSSDVFWTLLFNAGYLKPCNGAVGDIFKAELVNMEVKDTLSKYAKSWLREQPPSVTDTIQEFVDCLLRGDAEGVKRMLNDELLNNPSYFDFKEENSYHMFIYGILLSLSNDYTVMSNRESGKGRSDCVIKPNDKTHNAVVVEFKHVKDLNVGSDTELLDGTDSDSYMLAMEARKGLEQIEDKSYLHGLLHEGYTNILRFGIAFHKKTCEVAMARTV